MKRTPVVCFVSDIGLSVNSRMTSKICLIGDMLGIGIGVV